MSDTTGTYYYQPERSQPVELLANPPYATGTDYDAACGSGAWLALAITQGYGEPAEPATPRTDRPAESGRQGGI